jgi:serine/threonine protein kinase
MTNFLNENLNPKHYSLVKQIGKGAFSSVYLYKKNTINTTQPNKLVYKVIKDKYYKYSKKETDLLDLLSKYNNKYIVKYYGYFEKINTKTLVFEYLDSNLYNFYKNTVFYNINDIIKICYQIFKGLKFIHSFDIIHTDLKPENIMINEYTYKTKIIDFGSIQQISTQSKKHFYICTRYYRAPEIIYNINYNQSIDIWSAGCIFAELLMRKPLFPVKNEKQLFKLINNLLGSPKLTDYLYTEKYREQFIYKNANTNNTKLEYLKTPLCFKYKFNHYLDKYDSSKVINLYIIELLKKILNYDYNLRPTALECLKSPIFLEYNLVFINK